MKKRLCAIVVCAACLITGCSSVVSDMTEEQVDIAAEYAADLLLKYDKNYSDKYSEIETTTPAPTFAPEEVYTKKPDSNGNNSEKNNGEPSTTGSDTKQELSSIHSILGLNGVEVVPTGFRVVDSYPDGDAGEALFVMKPTKDYKLLIVSVKVTNISDKNQKINIMKDKPKFKAMLGQGEVMNAQITLLLDGFNTFEGVIKKGESQNMVLVYQTKTTDIKDLSLNVICNGKSGIITVK